MALAAEMLYDGKKRDEKTEKHLKRTFINQTNKIHREMVAEHEKMYGININGLNAVKEYFEKEQ